MNLCFVYFIMAKVKRNVHRSKGNGPHQKTKRRTKDVDQIYTEMEPQNIERTKREATKWDEDKPGLGQFYCISCAKYFINSDAMDAHVKTKPHKKRFDIKW